MQPNPDFLSVYSDQDGNLSVDVSDSWPSSWQRAERYIQAHRGTDIKVTFFSLPTYGELVGIMPQAKGDQAAVDYALAYGGVATMGMDIGPGGGSGANQDSLEGGPVRYPGRLLLWTNPVTHAPVWQTLVEPTEAINQLIQSQSDEVIITSKQEGPAELRVFTLANYGALNLEGYHGLFGTAPKEL